MTSYYTARREKARRAARYRFWSFGFWRFVLVQGMIFGIALAVVDYAVAFVIQRQALPIIGLRRWFIYLFLGVLSWLLDLLMLRGDWKQPPT